MESTVNSLKKQMQRNTEHYLNGMSHSFQTGIMGLTGLIAVPLANGIKFITGDKNYVSYEQYMGKVAELIDESSLTTAEDKDEAYYTGRDDGEVAFFFIMYEYADSISALARSNSGTSRAVTGGNNNSNSGYVEANIENDIIGKERVGSALKLDAYHKFNDIVDNYAGMAVKTEIDNGMLYQIEGSLNGVEGRFEWILQDDHVTHRMFIPGGKITGIPIKP